MTLREAASDSLEQLLEPAISESLSPEFAGSIRIGTQISSSEDLFFEASGATCRLMLLVRRYVVWWRSGAVAEEILLHLADDHFLILAAGGV